MRSLMNLCVLFCSALATMVMVGGCASGGPSLGGYGDSPIETKPRLGIYTFHTEPDKDSIIPTTAHGEYAADIAADMFEETGRFKVVRRKQLTTLLRDQKKTDMFKNEMLVQPAPIQGIDYVLTGSITGLSIKKEAKPLSFTQKTTGMFSKAASKKAVDVTVNCTVGLHLVDLKSGDEVVSNNSQFDRSGPAKSLGIDMMDSSTKFGELPVTEQDRESVIKIAIDDAIKKSLEKMDRYLKSAEPIEGVGTSEPVKENAPATAAGTGTPAPAPTAQQTPAPTMKKCPACGTQNDPSATICKTCGGKL